MTEIPTKLGTNCQIVPPERMDTDPGTMEKNLEIETLHVVQSPLPTHYLAGICSAAHARLTPQDGRSPHEHPPFLEPAREAFF